MRAIFFILFVFATLMIFLGYTASTNQSSTLGYTIITGGGMIYLGIAVTWILFKIKEKQDKEK